MGASEGGGALLFDGRRASTAGAAFANASTIDSFDAHDGHPLTKGHVGVTVVPALLAFASRYRRQPDLFQSFAVVFEGPGTLDEEGFERHLWERVQSLSDKDAWLGHALDDSVAHEPDSPHFSLSFAGEALRALAGRMPEPRKGDARVRRGARPSSGSRCCAGGRVGRRLGRSCGGDG